MMNYKLMFVLVCMGMAVTEDMLFLLLATLCLMFQHETAFILNDPSPSATTHCGPVAGLLKDGAYSFRGIPYATPPANRLRWRPPAALSKAAGNCWNGTFQATKYGNPCYQRDFRNTTNYIGNEDCLYVNVLTPTLDFTAKKHVMVWIHGGFLEAASGNWPLYSPTEKLAKKLDLVFVGFNYRLHAFGFMALQMLANSSPTNTSGNYGFMDMILALQWVQTNIVNFGGDPNKVTVFGQSSGGTSIYALLASPLCQGLFHKAWLLSASPVLNKTAADAYKDNEVFVRNANCSDVQCLYALTPEQVTAAVPWDVYPYWGMADQNDLPTKGYFDGALAIVDGHILPESPFDAWANGHMVDVPLLIGTCANEVDSNPPFPDLKNWTWTKYEDHVKERLVPFGDLIYRTAMMFYPSHHITPEFQLTSMASDLRMNCPNDIMAMYAAATFTSPVYRYVVTSVPSKPIPASYSFHGWDMKAFYGYIHDYIKPPTATDLAWQANIQSEVLSFVRSGAPVNISWAPYPAITVELSEKSTPTKAYNPQQCNFWLQNGFFNYAWIN